MEIFTKEGDYAAFIKLLEEARRHVPTVHVLGYCIMRDHWHLVLRPTVAKDFSRFMAWLCTTHVRRWRAHRASQGQGHLYQGRFKLFVAQDDKHFLTLLRFVEGNPLRTAIVRRA
jgi:putative transposase